jgi:exoribonuclease R
MPIIVVTGSAFSSVDPQGYALAKDFEKCLSFGPSPSDREAVMVLNAAEYFSHFWSHDASVTELCSSLIQSEIDMTIYSEDTVIDEQSRATSHKDFIYKEHLSANAIEEGTANGDLRIGIFHASKYTPDEGFVRPSNKGEASLLEILVPGRKLQNRALHGDLVAVHVFVSGNAEKQKSVELDDGSIDGETLNVAQNGSSHYGVHESLNLVGDDEEEHENHPVTVKHGVIKGEIVGIIQRAQRDYVACLDETEEVAVSVFNSRSS